MSQQDDIKALRDIKISGNPENIPHEVISGLDYALWGLEQAGYKFKSGRTACLILLAWTLSERVEEPEK